jgi:hypothetical protein
MLTNQKFTASQHSKPKRPQNITISDVNCYVPINCIKVFYKKYICSENSRTERKVFQTGSGLRPTTKENTNFDLQSKNHQGLKLCERLN